MMEQNLSEIVSRLIDRLCSPVLMEADVIPWGSPVPSFGDLPGATIATLGLNPSSREFVDVTGNELGNESRRFHTLRSLGLDRWSDAETRHVELIVDSCRAYFFRNPYDGWFKKLDHLISGTASYYDRFAGACHLDLIPYATRRKWSVLTRCQRSSLLAVAGDTLGLLLRASEVRAVVLNGSSVVAEFQNIAGIHLEKQAMPDWSLPRRSRSNVPGFGYKGTVRRLAGVELGREVAVLGVNHNIQSSFGVTTQARTAIRSWITQLTGEMIS